MMREYHVRICEGLGVKLPGSTRRLGTGEPERPPLLGVIDVPGPDDAGLLACAVGGEMPRMR